MTGALLAVAAALLSWPGGRRPLAGPSSSRGRPLDLSDILSGPVGSAPFAACVAAGVAAVLSTPLVAVLAGGCAALGARALRRRRDAEAGDRRLLALAEALGALTADLRAGRPIEQAATAAASACPDPHIGNRLAIAVRSAVAGTQPPDEHAEPELRRIGAAVGLSLRTGCSLAAVATALEDDLRSRHRLRLELRTATAGPRASAGVLAGLPAVGLAMGSGIGADPWRVLTTTGVGQVLLVVGVLLEVMGVAWVGRLTRQAAPELAGSGSGRGA